MSSTSVVNGFTHYSSRLPLHLTSEAGYLGHSNVVVGGRHLLHGSEGSSPNEGPIGTEVSFAFILSGLPLQSSLSDAYSLLVTYYYSAARSDVGSAKCFFASGKAFAFFFFLIC